MSVTAEYKLSMYQDYGQLNHEKDIHLVRSIQDGKICVKKVMDCAQKNVVEFRKYNSNPYIAQVYDYFALNDKLVVIEEYVEGVTLEQYTMGEGISEQEAVKFGYQICLALRFLHQANPMIVYRDLKPQNVMVTKENTIKLIDFDISREYEQGKTKDTQLLGTAEYAAPEQFGYFQTDNRTDIYAFGILLNYMLTGKLPSEKLTEGKYRSFVRKCIEFEPQNRYQSIEEVLRELKVPKTVRSYDIEHSWMIPGFRTHVWWKMMLAFIGYSAIIFFISALTSEFNFEDRILVGVSLGIFSLIALFITTNYRGIANKSKGLKSKKKIIRIIWGIGVWVASMFMAWYVILIVQVLKIMLE